MSDKFNIAESVSVELMHKNGSLNYIYIYIIIYTFIFSSILGDREASEGRQESSVPPSNSS
jgi:hypothetical protein